MPDPVWYRSLYWRFAIGFVALLATLLAVQGVVLLWMTGQMPEVFRTRSAAQFANTVAADLAAALKDEPDLDLAEFINKNHPKAFRPFVIAMKDCRFAYNERTPPFPILGPARERLGVDCPGGRGRGPGPGGPPPDDRFDGFGRGGYRPPPPPGGGGPGGPGGPGRGRGGGPRGRGGALEFAPVHVDTIEVAMIAVLDEPPDLMATARQAGPVLAIVGFALLVAGTAIAALVVFRPASRRLHDLQHAAMALGAGASGVRASETGGDEVTSLARAFNDMAGRLEERSTALEASNRTRRQLLADVSHELTTPLAAIRGYAETLGMSNLEIDDARRARYLRVIHEETIRLEHIVGDLLDLAKLEGGGGTFKIEPVSVAQLFERIHERHDHAMRSKNIELRTDIAADATTVTGDSNRLEQALQNLVANAVRHTPEGGRITVAADCVPEGVRLSVQDTGQGIPEEHLSRVFDRFYKVDVSRTGTALPSGSGLGLSIVQAIVTRHGGTIRASNPAGGGARFEILLPGQIGTLGRTFRRGGILAPRRVVTTALLLILAVTALVTAQQSAPAASANPDVAAALQRGNSALTRRDFEAALDAFTKANQLQGKTSAPALFGMARAFQGLDAFKSAADACVEGLKYIGTDTMLEAQLHNQRGIALLQLSQKPNDKSMLDAEAEFRTALTRTETLHDAWFNLGVALLKQNRDPDGIAALQAYVDSGLKTPQVDDAKRMIENPRRAREVYAPEFSIASMEGEYIQLKDLRGKVVLLDFWATWCGPCVAATPMLTELAKVRAKDSRFVLLSITDEAPGEAAKIRSFASQYKIAWPMIHDTSHKINAMYQIRSIPTYIVIDAEGIVRERVTGYSSTTRGTLDQAISKAIRAIDKK